MKSIDRKLYADYDRWKNNLADNLQYGDKDATLDEALRAHYLVVDYFFREGGEPIAAVGPRDEGRLLMSALGRQMVGYSGQMKWKDEYCKVATVFYGLVKNHPFHDGNKRVGLLIALNQLYKIGRIPHNITDDGLASFTERVAGNQLSYYTKFSRYEKTEDGRIQFIADYLKRKTRDEDKTLPRIDYRSLNKCLKRFGYELKNDDRNSINIYKMKGNWFWGPLGREKKIGTIGFPGWNRQVPKGTLRSLITDCGLHAAAGRDSRVVFDGYDPLGSLIPIYEKPLKRLQDR